VISAFIALIFFFFFQSPSAIYTLIKNNSQYIDMSKLQKLSLAILLTLLLSLLSNTVHAGGFAAGPGKMYFNKVLRGGYAEQEIYLYNPEDRITDIEISVEGSFADWTYFDSGKRFSIPTKGTRYVKTYIEPPADIANGIYEGTINLVSKPRRIPTIDGHGMSIETAISLKVFIEITGEQIVRYKVKNIAVQSVEEGYDIPVSIIGINKGNVKVSPKVRIDLHNWDKSILINSYDFTLGETLPTTEKTYNLNISSEGLAEGQYWANVSVFVAGNIIEDNRGFQTFDIMKKGSLTRKGELINIRTGNSWIKVGDVARVDAVFKNTGQISTNAKFRGEVYFNGILIETLESDELEVPIGKTVNLTVYYTPLKPGRYTINGVVYYSGKMTYEKGTVLNISPAEKLIGSVNSLDKRIVVAILLTFLIITLYLQYRTKNSGYKDHDLKSVSGKFTSVENNLEKIMRDTKRMNKKIQRLKTRRI